MSLGELQGGYRKMKFLHYILNTDPKSIVHRFLKSQKQERLGTQIKGLDYTIFDEYGKRVYDLCADALQSQY